jgi:hypothetical protein
MPVAYEVIATTGTYTNRDGQEKKRWQKIGVVMQTAKGLTLKMESVPVGWDGWAPLADPRRKDEDDAPF